MSPGCSCSPIVLLVVALASASRAALHKIVILLMLALCHFGIEAKSRRQCGQQQATPQYPQSPIG
ncbi:uncharacterized protein K489DRAFT_385307 [Dissoconium aciculare CBS 342.82]|uniref:Uncharacterized protein n=1 Tax=Dissoconium aciculare CBS 342.82 TaxID=1314786 RepID=A0A6J3LRX7_9PEZI|nr:uncharacterized protein K489DRAFT_385307 [Dissoconium aciculare CBS 342.82]KAF1818039.1 hypothetical protein K489DRAFT_385307 [Dissoconium aciculare CBS 342.82]